LSVTLAQQMVNHVLLVKKIVVAAP